MLREMGSELRAAREKRGLTIADVQAETKIRSRYLEALEEGRMEVLPGDVYARGFLKSYADFLGLDGRAVVERYKQWQSEQQQPQTADTATAERPAFSPPRPAPSLPRAQVKVPRPAEPAFPTRGKRRLGRGLGPGVAVLLTAAIAAGAWLAWQSSQAARSDLNRPDQVGASPTDRTAVPSTPSGQRGTGGPNSSPRPAAAVTLEAGTPPNQFTVPFTVRGTAGGPLQLTITVSQSCWIRLERAGQEAVEETLSAGSSRTWDFTGEARLKLGNPPAARLQVSGVAVPDPTATYPVTYVFTQAQP